MVAKQTSGTALLAGESATEEFGQRLAAAIRTAGRGQGACITLQGDLGAGKTTLVRGFMRGYGFNGPVKSPTYTLVEPYEFAEGNIYHFDLYRISDPAEVEFLGVAEYFAASNVCLIEWPERGAGQIPETDLAIRLEGSGATRSLSWHAESPRGEILAERLVNSGRNP